ncbi:MAG: hypoxanthine phosphoribosyltransferase [Planctomycetaceae bacterium]|jgi:hypoxanthine phosphoribosyltransferase|nr:hypoxanthine phosphoribosyltransferase [Planctomycetaceae bacterium]
MKILFDQEQIRQGITQLGSKLNEQYGQSPITVVAIMTGSLVMLADLIRCLEMPLRISLIRASSYRGGISSGELHVEELQRLDIQDRDVLLIDDIFDTGKTLLEVSKRLEDLRPRSLKTAVFLNKQGTSQVQLKPDFSVFDIPNKFVVGYGLDYDDYYRNLPYVAVLEPSDLEQHHAASR